MNSLTNLSDDGAGAKFLMRWRGRQEGPYPVSVIEAKLAANEIGLLHEILYRDKWITLRDYILEREAVVRAELQAQAELAKLAQEEADRQAKQREDMRREEISAEERRRNAQLESDRVRDNANRQFHATIPPVNEGSSGLRIFGVLLLIAGLAVSGYFFFAFDASVESGYGRVNNLGLMADRQNGIIIGIGLGIVGAIMLAIGSRGKNK